MKKQNDDKFHEYRIGLHIALIISCGALLTLIYCQLDSSIPSTLYVRSEMEDFMGIGLPATAELVSVESRGDSNIPENAVTLDLREPVSVDIKGDYRMQVKLFGFLPFKQVDIRTVEEDELIPVGKPVGIYLKADGILVVGIGDFTGENGLDYSPSKNILQSGDYIRKLDGEEMNDKDLFIERIRNSHGKELTLTVERGEEMIEQKVTPIKDETGIYRIGIWIRDNAQGVGTMTFVDRNGNFGALGHGINDVDTSLLMRMDDGTLYETEIVAIHRGRVGEPGEMIGMIVYADDKIIGDIHGNSTRGIFGKCNEKGMEMLTEEPLPIGLKQEIEKGKAQILCTVEDSPRYYDIEITAVHMNNDNVNRGIEFVVTDEELLRITGGIIQGMSGAPIVQNGRFIGAVTHVLVNDPTKGYGIFIENMIGNK